MATDIKKPIYGECANKYRPTIDLNLNPDKLKEIGYNFRVLPTFEKSMYERAFMEYCSFQKNQRLKCKWESYVLNVDGKVFAPFQFPDIRDLHIDKHSIRYMPSENRFRYNNRLTLRAGPYIDERGPLPIPNEMLYSRGGEGKVSKKSAQKQKQKPKKSLKTAEKKRAVKNSNVK
ncbi:uncharacterized protein LOC113505455 [Trichoplusia ni]|uniref:Uncharacterized protein LOC113505455 n=1 Tax=Trichoplusia ni TaxID=7111 RepID=A0A7E5WTS5_TRINI|nr:uncharacterized protein LOC113505455 [Trichoplusia ni]